MKVRELLATAEVPGGEPLRLFRRDRDYIVKNDQVVIIDEFTGRMMDAAEAERWCWR